MSQFKHTSCLHPRFMLVLLLSTLLVRGVYAFVPSPQISAPQLVTAGYFQLNWTSSVSGAPEFQVQESLGPSLLPWRTIYTGTDRARVMSGKPNGTFYYRIRLLGENVSGWSAPIAVSSRHHPLSRAISFFLVGAMVFLLTLTLILHPRHLSRD